MLSTSREPWVRRSRAKRRSHLTRRPEANVTGAASTTVTVTIT
jgi:hypothetical protein